MSLTGRGGWVGGGGVALAIVFEARGLGAKLDLDLQSWIWTSNVDRIRSWLARSATLE